MRYPRLNPVINTILQNGTVIPAHPLALTGNRLLDEEHQRALTRYYLASGAGGIAVGVHTTQFEIRDPKFNLLEPVLELAAREVDAAGRNRSVVKIAGICGPTRQALKEAELAAKHGYQLGLLSMGGLHDYTESDLLERAHKIAEVIPVFGFYLQPAVGGRVLGYSFWREFVKIANVYAIKIAAFNRYRTLDVVRAVMESDRWDQIALYTGNDDHIIEDLLTPFRLKTDDDYREKRIVGGLLGHWAVWTSKAVELLNEIKQIKDAVPSHLLRLAAETTDANGAIFDVANNFKGCIPGIHEILKRQGLLRNGTCLNPDEKLSSGQIEEIDRIYKWYPHLNDDAFVQEQLEKIFNSSSRKDL
ncbi:MAG: hypothetical protein WD097_01460 [Balneolales bacterium]